MPMKKRPLIRGMLRLMPWTLRRTCQRAAATTVTVTFDNGATQSLGALAAGGSGLVYLPNLSSLPDGYNGSAIVTSSDGTPLLAVVNIDLLDAGSTGADFSRPCPCPCPLRIRSQ